MPRKRTDTQLDLWSYTTWQAPQDEHLTGDVFLESGPGPLPGDPMGIVILTAVNPRDGSTLEELAEQFLYEQKVLYFGSPIPDSQKWKLELFAYHWEGFSIPGMERLVYQCVASGVVAGQVRLIFEFVRCMGDLQKNLREDDDLGDY